MQSGQNFESRRLMVSHGNEYRAPGDPRRVDTQRLMKSTKGLEETKTPK